MQDLSGKKIVSTSNKSYILDAEIGKGAQGVIYSETTGKFLIKLFLGRRNLETNLNKLKKLLRLNYPPRFIRPIDIIEVRNNDGELILAGYVMQKVVEHFSLNKLLMPPEGANLSDWYNVFSGGLKRRLYLSYLIAMNFYLLHRNNVAYCDVSGNNILVAENPQKASVCMIDIDNLYTPGYELATVLGTPRYMAPEIGKGQLQPDILSDDYSLAVIIFELLKCGHPYIGDFVEQSSPEVEEMAFLGKMPYIEDPDNDENRSSSVLPNDAVFNEKLTKMFLKTFVDGKLNRMSRSTSWDMALKCLEASNALMKCEHCGAWYFPNNKTGTLTFQCPWCDESNRLDAYFLVYKRYPTYYSSATGETQSMTENNKNVKGQITYVLKKNEANEIPENYLHTSISDSEIAKETDKFNIIGNIKIALRVACFNGVWKIQNVSGRTFYLRKGNRGDLIPFETNTVIEIMNGDCIYTDEEKQKDNLSYDEIMKEDIKPVVFLQFNIR